MPTQRQTILTDAVGRLAQILTSNDYQTNAGADVFLGEKPELGADDPDEIIAIVIGDDEVRVDSKKTFITLPLELQAIVKVTQTNASLRAEAMLGDLKTAMETDAVNGRRELGGYPLRRGTTRTLPREPGSTTAGVGVTYFVDYSEAWANP